MTPLRTLQIGLAALALAPAAPMAQSLIVNGQFHSGLGGWEFPDAAPFWSPLDADGSPTSGSARAVHPGGKDRLCVLRQCVAAPGGGTHTLSVRAYTPPGQGNGNLMLSYTARYNSPDCTGDSYASGGTYLPSVGAWTHYAMTIPVEGNPPPPNTTIQVWACVDSAPGASFEGHFDNLRLDPGYLLFHNGFE